VVRKPLRLLLLALTDIALTPSCQRRYNILQVKRVIYVIKTPI